MTDAAPISHSERILRGLLADPAAAARWYAEKRIGFLEYKIERAREKLAALEAELELAREEWRAIEAGDAEPKHSDESLAHYAKDQREEHQAINRSEFQTDRNLIDEALDLTGLRARGWFVTESKADDWGEYVILARSRWSPRKRNNAKHVLGCLHQGIAAFEAARAEGASQDECSRIARATYDEALGDLGGLTAIETEPVLFAVNAYRNARIENQRLPKKDWEPKAWAAFRAALEGAATRATGPPN